MASLSGSGHKGSHPSSAQRKVQTPGYPKGSPARRVGDAPVFSVAVTRKNLSKSVTEFFSKLRPSKRPERGGTARPAADDAEEHQRIEPTSPRPSGSCRRKRPSSLNRHGPDTIPASRWNTPTTLPRRTPHSAGAWGRNPAATQRPLDYSGRNTNPLENRLPLPPYPQQHPNLPLNTANPYNTPAVRPTTTTPQEQQQYHHHPKPTPTPDQSTPRPPPTPHDQVLAANRALRRRRQHTLISSGDFLGVTGVNPYTGEPDIITPPTSSDDAIVTTTTTTSSSPPPPLLANNTPALMMLTDRGYDRRDGGGDGDGNGNGNGDEDEAGRLGRRVRREEERLRRAEQRKEALREVLAHKGVRWRREEGGWSSVAEPKLSPILQSPPGSGKSASVQSAAAVGGGTLPTARDGSFLGLPAAVAGVGGCRRRRFDGNSVTVRGDMRVVLMQQQQQHQGQTSLGTVGGKRQRLGRGLCPLRKVMVRFCLPPPVHRREGSLQEDANNPTDYQPEWEPDSLMVVPVDLRRLSEDCRARRMSTGRVLELSDSDSAKSWTMDSQLHDKSSTHSQTDVAVKGRSREIVHGLGQAVQYACTRTTTTTGFEHGRPRHRMPARPFDAIPDESHEAPPNQRALMPRAHSRSTSPLSSTTTPSSACSSQPASPGTMQLSIWRNLNSPGLPIAEATWKRVGAGRAAGSHTPLLRLEPEADSDTTSSTDQETIAPPHEDQHSVTARQPAAGDENDRPQQQQQGWTMRKTMRKPPPGSPNLDDEADTGRSSPTSTRTSTYPMTQPRPLRAAVPPWQNQTEMMIARGAARTAFVHHEEHPEEAATTSGRMPISASVPNSHRPHGRAAEMTAKGVARPGTGVRLEKGTRMLEENGKGKSERRERGQTEKGEGRLNNREDMSHPEIRYWAQNAMVMLASVVGAYWQVVSPVFDGNSHLRKRVDQGQATRGDVVVCGLTVVFLFLVVSSGVWAVRGIVWTGRLLSRFGEVLGAVVGLRG